MSTLTLYDSASSPKKLGVLREYRQTINNLSGVGIISSDIARSYLVNPSYVIDWGWADSPQDFFSGGGIMLAGTEVLVLVKKFGDGQLSFFAFFPGSITGHKYNFVAATETLPPTDPENSGSARKQFFLYLMNELSFQIKREDGSDWNRNKFILLCDFKTMKETPWGTTRKVLESRGITPAGKDVYVGEMYTYDRFTLVRTVEKSSIWRLYDKQDVVCVCHGGLGKTEILRERMFAKYFDEMKCFPELSYPFLSYMAKMKEEERFVPAFT